MSVARIVKVGSPYNAVDLFEIDTEQSADVMYMAHWDYAPTKLERYSNTSWAFVTLTFGPTTAAPSSVVAVAHNPNQDNGNNGASYFPEHQRYFVTTVNDDIGQESRASTAHGDAQNDLTLKRNYNSLSWSAVDGATRYRVYKSVETGSVGYIGTTTYQTFTDDNIQEDQTQAPPNGFNPFSGAGNYPSTVAFFEQRLMWGRTRNVPNGIWGSKSSDFENMDYARPVVANDSLAFKVVGAKANAVNQLVSLNDLLALTSDNVFKITGAADQGYLRPDQIVVRRQAGRGFSRLNPVVIDDVVFGQTAVGNEVRSIGYTFESDGYKTDDVTIFSPHLFKGFDILWWAYAEHPDSLLWVGRSDGALLCFTWQAEQKVWGWTICQTDGFPESGTVIEENGESRLYMVVRRVIGGVTKRFIERMASATFDDTNFCFLDAAITAALDQGDTIVTGLAALEGAMVTAIVGGNIIGGLVVTDAQVTLPYAAPADNYIVTVGLPYDTLVETLPLSAAVEGTNSAKRQMVGQAVVRVLNSRGISAGPDDAHLFPLKPRSTEAYGSPNMLLSGDYEVDMAPVTSGQSSIVVTSSPGVPFELLGVLLDPIVAGS